MFLIGLLFSARHFNTNLMWSAFSFINRLRTTSAGLSSPATVSYTHLLVDTCATNRKLLHIAAYHLGGLIVPSNVQQLTVGSAGVHQQVYDLVDNVLVIRAEPEQKVYLQRLRKIFFQLFTFAHPVVFIGIDRISIAYLCIISLSLIFVAGCRPVNRIGVAQIVSKCWQFGVTLIIFAAEALIALSLIHIYDRDDAEKYRRED